MRTISYCGLQCDYNRHAGRSVLNFRYTLCDVSNQMDCIENLCQKRWQNFQTSHVFKKGRNCHFSRKTITLSPTLASPYLCILVIPYDMVTTVLNIASIRNSCGTVFALRLNPMQFFCSAYFMFWNRAANTAPCIEASSSVRYFGYCYCCYTLWPHSLPVPLPAPYPQPQTQTQLLSTDQLTKVALCYQTCNFALLRRFPRPEKFAFNKFLFKHSRTGITRLKMKFKKDHECICSI